VFDTAQTDRLLDLLPEILNAKVQRQADGSVNISR
jgi:ferric-dicitrate binding protein FerR (iron transport regulator)